MDDIHPPPQLTTEQQTQRIEHRLALVERKIDYAMSKIVFAVPSLLAGMPPRPETMLEQFINIEQRQALQAQGIEPARIIRG